MGLEISKVYSFYNNFHPIPAKLYAGITYHVGMQAINFLGNRQSFTKFVALRIFNMGVKGKILKCTYNILKTDDCRAKWMKSYYSRS